MINNGLRRGLCVIDAVDGMMDFVKDDRAEGRGSGNREI